MLTTEQLASAKKELEKLPLLGNTPALHTFEPGAGAAGG